MPRSIFKLICAAILSLLAMLSSMQSIAMNNETEGHIVASLQPGEVVGKHIFGLARDFQDTPLMVNDDPLIYDEVNKEIDVIVAGNRFRLSFFNHSAGGVYISDIDSETRNALDTRALSLGKLGGVYGISSVVKTEWNSALFSENRMFDASKPKQIEGILKHYFKAKEDLVKSYNYGWINEIIVLDAQGNAKGIKNFAAGRTFASHIIAMPDAKTFYLFDTQYSGNAYVFIADEAQSFSKGVLYVLSESTDLKSNTIEVVELGKSSALKMKFKLKKASFSSLFKKQDLNNGVCASTFTYVETVYGQECLKAQKKNRKYVGQFEPIRTAALKGVKPLVRGASEISFDSHNSVIKVTHNDGQIRQYKLSADAELGTKYILTK